MVILLQWESGGGLEKERRERERNEGKKEEKRERKTGREDQSGCDKHSTEDTRKTGINPDSRKNRIS